MHSLAIALHQHLAYACCASEVAIYLERWMGIKEVRVGATAAVFAVLVDFRAYVGEQLAVYLISFVSTMQTSPEVDSPACTPTGGNYEINLVWNNGKVSKASITSKNAGNLTVKYNGKQKALNFKAGETKLIK
jgi:hypothetical protein